MATFYFASAGCFFILAAIARTVTLFANNSVTAAAVIGTALAIVLGLAWLQTARLLRQGSRRGAVWGWFSLSAVALEWLLLARPRPTDMIAFALAALVLGLCWYFELD